MWTIWAATSFPCYNLENKNTIAEDISLLCQMTMHYVFRSHVASARNLVCEFKISDCTVARQDNEMNDSVRSLAVNMEKGSYNVPATPVVRWVTSSPKALARPKSVILGFNLSSNRILLALMSRWIIRVSDSSWI